VNEKETIERHKKLHAALDELFACYITEHPEEHGFFKMEFGHFLEWSHKMTQNPTCVGEDHETKEDEG